MYSATLMAKWQDAAAKGETVATLNAQEVHVTELRVQSKIHHLSFETHTSGYEHSLHNKSSVYSNLAIPTLFVRGSSED